MKLSELLKHVKPIAVIGDSEAENNTVSINIRGNKKFNDVPLDKFVEMCVKMNEEKPLRFWKRMICL